jgi:hypothetical protein
MKPLGSGIMGAGAVKGRAESGRQRKHFYKHLCLLLAVFCLVLVSFVAVGCASGSSRAELHYAGMYRYANDDGFSCFYLRFNEDGTLKGALVSSEMSENEVGSLLSYAPPYSGTYEIDGEEIIFEYTGGVPLSDKIFHFEGKVEADKLVVINSDGEKRTFNYVG